MISITEESVVSSFVTAVTNKINSLITSHNTNANAHSTKAHISYGQVDSTSTSTAFTATVSGITALTDGTSVMLRNGRVTSAAGFTLNVNGLGAKPVYSSMADATADTTIFNINYTMLFVYDSSRINGGCWICYRGYNTNDNTLGYQIRTNSQRMYATDKTYRYRLLLQVDDTHYMPVNTSTSTAADTSKTSTMNTREFKLGGKIIYYSYTSAINAGAQFGATYHWIQYPFALGYSFNNTNAALALTTWSPVYMVAEKSTTNAGMAKLVSPYYTQTLPSSEDGKLYIFLGQAYNATNIEMTLDHPIYEYKNGGIRLYRDYYTTAETDNLLSGKANSSHTHSNYLTSHQDITGKEDITNKVTSLSSSSTDTQYPSAKAVYDTLSSLSGSEKLFYGIMSDRGYVEYNQGAYSVIYTLTCPDLDETTLKNGCLIYTKKQPPSYNEMAWVTQTENHVVQLAIICGKDNYKVGFYDNNGETVRTSNGGFLEANYITDKQMPITNMLLFYVKYDENAYDIWDRLFYTLSGANLTIDNLTSTDTQNPLSANQGKELKTLIDGKASSSHNHTVSNITDFPTIPSEAEFITGAFNNVNSYVMLANTSKTSPTDGDRFYVHLTDTSISTSDTRITVTYNGQYSVNGAIYKNGTTIKSNELKIDTILLIELVVSNGYSWNIIEAFNGNITKDQSFPIEDTLKVKLGDEWAYIVSEVTYPSGKKAYCKITNLSSSELSSNDSIYIKIPSYQTNYDYTTYIQLSDMSSGVGIPLFNSNNQNIKESDINGKIIYATYDGSKFVVSNIYSTSRLMALISELPTKTSDLTNDSGFINSTYASTSTPLADTTSGSYGSGTSYARENHTHPKSSLYAESTHTHTVSNITDFPSFKTINNESIVGTGNITITGGGSEAEFVSGSFSASSSYIIVANSSKSTIDDGDRFYVHITNTSTSTSNASLSIGYGSGNYYANGTIYNNYTPIQSNQIIADTIILVECSISNGYSWNIIEMWSYAPVNHTHSDYVNPTIVDNLTTNDSTQVLSAKQGKVLNDKIGDIITIINGTGGGS